MKKGRFKIYHLLTVMIITTFLFRYNEIWNGFVLLFNSIIMIFKNPIVIYNKININISEYILTILFLIILLNYILIKNKKPKIFYNKVNISTAILIITLYLVVFAPVITDFHPNHQSNVAYTRFLPPLSKVIVVKIDEQKGSITNWEQSVKRCIKKEASLNEYYIPVKSVKEDSIRVRISGKEYIISENQKSNLSISKKIFLLGTDELGRDIFSRIVFGARVSLFIAILTVILSVFIGTLLGYISATGNIITNIFLSRITDAFLSIPAIFFVIMILSFWGNSILGVIVVLSFTGWMSVYKIVKMEVIAIKEKDYFVTSRKLGLSKFDLFRKEIIPIIIAPLSVSVVFQFSNVILAESALSFLGLGVGINYPSWGNLILAGQKYMDSAWWLLLFPSLVLVLILLSLNSVGEKIKQRINPLLNIE